MIVYKDIFNGDEVMSEVFKYTLDYDDVIMKVQATYKKKENVGNVDIGNLFLIKDVEMNSVELKKNLEEMNLVNKFLMLCTIFNL